MRNAVRSLSILALAMFLTSALPANAQNNHSNEPGAVFVMTNNVDRNAPPMAHCENVAASRPAAGALGA